ncbi:MAG: hypothetical protein HYX59_08515 [Elusimicrobia bacterium]|nr:hypothetical protein [Elusimicrobiota bacterium]
MVPTAGFDAKDAVQSLSTIFVAVIAVFSVVFQTSGVPKRLTVKLLTSDERIIQLLFFSLGSILVLVYFPWVASRLFVALVFTLGLTSNVALGYFLYADYIGLQALIRHIATRSKTSARLNPKHIPTELDELAISCYFSNQDTVISETFEAITTEVAPLLLDKEHCASASDFLGRLFQTYPERAFDEGRRFAAKLIINQLAGCGVRTTSIINNKAAVESGWSLLEQLNTIAVISIKSPSAFHRFYLDDIYGGAVVNVLRALPENHPYRSDLWKTVKTITASDIESNELGLATRLSTALGAWAYESPATVDVQEYLAASTILLQIFSQHPSPSVNNSHTRLSSVLLVQFRAIWEQCDPIANRSDWASFLRSLQDLRQSGKVDSSDWIAYSVDSVDRLANRPSSESLSLIRTCYDQFVGSISQTISEQEFRYIVTRSHPTTRLSAMSAQAI